MATVVNQTNRGPGVIDSGTLDLATVLGGAPQANTIYIGTVILDAVDRDDPTLVMAATTLYIDGQIVWGPTDMTGGMKDRNGNAISPHFEWGYGGAGAATCRITMDLSRRVRIGLDVSTTPMVR